MLGQLLELSIGASPVAQSLAEYEALGFRSVPVGDIVEGVTMVEKLDEVTGLSRKVIIESRAADLRPRISLKGADGTTRTIQRSLVVKRGKH